VNKNINNNQNNKSERLKPERLSPNTLVFDIQVCKMANIPPLVPGKNLFTYVNNYNKERKKRMLEEKKKREHDILDLIIPRKKIKPFYFKSDLEILVKE